MKLVSVEKEKVGSIRGVTFFGQDPRTVDFETRVEADGGVVEKRCLGRRIASLMRFSVTATYVTPFIERVATDGGAIEGVSCLVANLETINNN